MHVRLETELQREADAGQRAVVADVLDEGVQVWPREGHVVAQRDMEDAGAAGELVHAEVKQRQVLLSVAVQRRTNAVEDGSDPGQKPGVGRNRQVHERCLLAAAVATDDTAAGHPLPSHLQRHLGELVHDVRWRWRRRW